MPTFEELENPKSSLASEIISSDGKVIGKYYIENRSNVGFAGISPNVVNALIATEDARFFKHSGVDLRALMRVIKGVILRSENSGGGSTITQQLAKNLFPRERNGKLALIDRKLKEWIIAVKLEKNYTKEEIMAMYLNTVDFGSNAFGIRSASKIFFDRSQDSLEIEQAAVLVGLLKAPSYYSPIRQPEHCVNRRNTVLSQMEKYGYLRETQFDSLKAKPLGIRFNPEDHNSGTATYFREFLRDELKRWLENNKKPDGSKYDVYKDGLRIYTTIDSRMQEYAELAMKEWLGKELQPQFFKHWANRKDAPFYNMTPDEIKSLMEQGMKRSDRYRILKQAGLDEGEIKKNFNTKIPMTVYTWKGEVDTNLTPWDSIRYYKHFLQAGVMSVDPHTGHVKAWVGGINYKHFKYDHVKQGKRQVGSTFKPFV